MNARLPVISMVIPFYNEAGNVDVLYRRIATVLETTRCTWEIVCVNDGSSDGTLENLLALRHREPRVRVLDLSRNFAEEAALTAGLDHARGRSALPALRRLSGGGHPALWQPGQGLPFHDGGRSVPRRGQLMALGVIGEYVGRIYEESKRRPIYIIRELDDPGIRAGVAIPTGSEADAPHSR